jgi:hypothetical protein
MEKVTMVILLTGADEENRREGVVDGRKRTSSGTQFKK